MTTVMKETLIVLEVFVLRYSDWYSLEAHYLQIIHAKLLLKQFGHKTFLSKIIAKFEQILIRIYIICAPQIMNK